MNEYFLLYLFTRLDTVENIFVFSFVLGSAASLLLYALMYIEEINLRAPRRLAVAMFFVGGVGAILVPNKADVAIILGGKMAIDIARSEEVSDVSKKILQAINKKLDEAGK